MNKETKFPTLFVSHGSPRVLQTEAEDTQSIRDLTSQFPKPRAIVVVSAHWIDDPVAISNMDQLSTVHDFGGFARELYQLQYPAKGDAALSKRIAELLQQQGIQSKLHADRGLDHGSWVPLMLMYPEVDIPVVQVSLAAGSLEQQVKIGEALRPLREEGVLIIGSGGSVHNLSEMRDGGTTDQWAINFEEWLRQGIEGNDFDQLISVDQFPPELSRAHPSIDHYVPIIVAWAAGDRSKAGKRIHHSFSYTNLGMSHYLFGCGD
jgi:4,5-DOPA dioxygenase extradiol